MNKPTYIEPPPLQHIPQHNQRGIQTDSFRLLRIRFPPRTGNQSRVYTPTRRFRRSECFEGDCILWRGPKEVSGFKDVGPVDEYYVGGEYC